jgi:hypothetical protein
MTKYHWWGWWLLMVLISVKSTYYRPPIHTKMMLIIAELTKFSPCSLGRLSNNYVSCEVCLIVQSLMFNYIAIRSRPWIWGHHGCCSAGPGRGIWASYYRRDGPPMIVLTYFDMLLFLGLGGRYFWFLWGFSPFGTVRQPVSWLFSTRTSRT